MFIRFPVKFCVPVKYSIFRFQDSHLPSEFILPQKQPEPINLSQKYFIHFLVIPADPHSTLPRNKDFLIIFQSFFSHYFLPKNFHLKSTLNKDHTFLAGSINSSHLQFIGLHPSSELPLAYKQTKLKNSCSSHLGFAQIEFHQN